MRVLIIIPHYCRPTGNAQEVKYASLMNPWPRVAALNETIVALHRHFGPHRFQGPATDAGQPDMSGVKLDIVIVTVKGHNVLDQIGIDDSYYDVEYFDGEPLMLSFETQRILRERLSGYDIYGMMEDDLVIHDPEFLNKIVWFQEMHGPQAALQPQRYEQSKTGDMGAMLIDTDIDPIPEFWRKDAPEQLTDTWHGREVSFRHASNPHSGCSFVTHEQLTYWVEQPEFYDRDTRWVGPLESAATRSFAIAFDVYKPMAPDPIFLSVEHGGTRYMNRHASARAHFGDNPLELTLLAGTATRTETGARTTDVTELVSLQRELETLRREVRTLRRVADKPSRALRYYLARHLGDGLTPKRWSHF